MMAGFGLVLLGIVLDDIARSLGGAVLVMTAAILLFLSAVKGWTTDTQAERARLADATREADAEHMRYVAAQAALAVERQRVQRDAAAEREHNAARLAAERTALRDQFEEERAQLICKTMETTVHLYRAGMLDDKPEPAHAKVIDLLPHQEPARHRAAESTHDRGATR